MIKHTLLHRKVLFPILSAVVLASTTASSQAAVIVYFDQVGTDVTARWTGTLDTITMTDTTRASNSVSIDLFGSTSLYHTGPGVHSYYSSNNSTGSAVILASNDGFNPPVFGGTQASFGFTGGTFYFHEIHISQGILGAVTQLAFDPLRDVILFKNTNLTTMGADSFSNTLAWTAVTTGDTITYNTGIPATIPEPSTTWFLALASGTLFFRRRHALA